MYLVHVSEIGRYFSWLLLCGRACPVQPSALFLSWVLLLGFGRLLIIKKKCHCRFVVMWMGFPTNCQNKLRSKSFHQTFTHCFFTCHNPHSSTGRYVCITDFVHDETYFKVRTYLRPSYLEWRGSAPGADTGEENDIKVSVVEQPAQSPES